MKFKIVADSCCDLDEQGKKLDNIEIVPLTLHIAGTDIVDDESFDQMDFIRRVAASKECPKSSCPSPGMYMEAYEGDYDCVFVVTLSANLSGSWNSAEVGKKMYYEEHPDDAKKIHVFDSCSASAGEARIAEYIHELASSGQETFETIVEKVNAYKLEMKTYFVIETLETLRKNGRLTGLQAIIANVLNIKPVMGATDDGVIIKLDQARGMDKALRKLAQIIAEQIKNPSEKVLAITHCNCKERALEMKAEIEKLVKFKDITIGDTRGVATMYANDGGIIISV
ncbi:MAG: DegV family protein [Lachnospiraceae bacterium]